MSFSEAFFQWILPFCAGIILSILVLYVVYSVKRKKYHIDYMTGLPDFRALLTFLKARRKGKYVFVLIDIDDFRRFNRESYEKGDQVIREFALLLQKEFGTLTRIFRYKLGDEFVLVCPVEHYNLITDKLKILSLQDSLQFSYSCIEFSARLDSPEDIFSKAGQKLIQQKSQE